MVEQLCSLATLPDELLLHILSFLDIPDLLALTRASHTLRTLSLDPLLHRTRLHRASLSLAHSIPLRPSLRELMVHRIYITRTTLAARSLGRDLISIKLNRQLGRRPPVEELVQMGVLPRECYGDERRGGWLAPGLVEVKRRVERERVKDVLRGWVGEWVRRRGEKEEGVVDDGRPDVGRLVRRFARERSGGSGSRWGRERERERERKEEPPRAKVLGLKRFWERVNREGGEGSDGGYGRGMNM